MSEIQLGLTLEDAREILEIHRAFGEQLETGNLTPDEMQEQFDRLKLYPNPLSVALALLAHLEELYTQEAQP